MTVKATTTADEVRAMLTFEQVRERIPLSAPTIKRLISDGLFPKPKPVGAHRNLFFNDEIVAWQRDLADPASELSKAIEAKNALSRKGLTQRAGRFRRRDGE